MKSPPLLFVALLLALLLPSATSAGESWDSPHSGNPILPGYYADPSLLQSGGKFYLYATIDPWGGRTLGCWESADFKSWTFRELNWPTKEACTSPTSRASMVWAPSVLRAPDGKFFMYVSVGSEVWVGSADHPLGPWHDANGGKPLVAATWNPTYHMIDAEGFIDDDGRAYLYWGSGWDWRNGHCFAVRLKPDMVTFDGEPRDVTPAGHYFEGPFMVKHGGKYFLTYSDGITVADNYCVYSAVGSTPLGPFTEDPAGPILSTDKSRNIVSPGHHAVFTRDGHTYILYHRHSVPYVPGQAFRQTCVDELNFTADGLITTVTPTHCGPPRLRRRESATLPAAATASSQLDDLHGPSCVLDDNYATRWAAAPGTHGGWLQLDLGSVRHVARSELRFEYAWKPYHFTLETSHDGVNWVPLIEHSGESAVGSPFEVDSPVDCRYLRLVFPADVAGETLSLFEWQVGAGEVKALASPGQEATPAAVQTEAPVTGFKVPRAWTRRGMVMGRPTEAADSSVSGDPCIVWDEAINGWRMIFFRYPPGHGQAVCLNRDDIGPGQWKFEGPLPVANPEAVGFFHKPFVVMDPYHPNQAAKIDGRYCLLVVSTNQAGRKQVQRA